MKKKISDRLTSFYESYRTENQELFENDLFAKNMYKALLAGDKKVFQKNVSETKIFDEKWIETLESYFPSIDKIMRNPKSALKYEDEVVPIEKARKIDSKSIRHLSANTHLIKEIDGDDIKPKKILTTFSDVDYATYENRMVVSLIDRLFYFVRSRAEVIKEFGDSFQNKSLSFNADFPFNEVQLTFDLKLNIKEEPENQEINKYNKQLLQRVERLETMVSGFRRSPLVTALKDSPKVRTPIMKTSIILKNPDYKNCYMLWLFLDRYNTLAFETEIKEKNMKLDGQYLESIYQDIVVNLASIMYHQENRRQEYNEFDKVRRKRALKVIKDLDVNPLLDEEFTIEDQYINQYYLEQNKRLFKQSLEYHQATSSTYEVALKKALRETLEFSNQLYHDFFEFEKEDDIFRRLITSMSPQDELKEIRDMAKIAKAIREVKEVDYRRILSLERRLLTRIATLDKVLINSAERGLLSLIEMQKDEMKLQSELDQSIIEAENLKQEIELTKKYQAELNQLARDVNNRFREIEREYRQKERESLKEVRQEFNALHKLTLAQMNEEHQAKLAEIETSHQNTIDDMHENFILMQEDLISKYQQALRDEGISVTDDFRAEVALIKANQAKEEAALREQARKELYQQSLDLGSKHHDLKQELEEYSKLKRQEHQQKVAISNNPVGRRVRQKRTKLPY